MIGIKPASISRSCIIWGTHSSSIFARSVWNGSASGLCMMRGPGCAAGESGPSGGWLYQRLDQLVTKADNLVDTHVAADHALGQTRLKRLVDDQPAIGEISLTAGDELAER